MEELGQKLNQNLQSLIALHRQLLEVVRMEREALNNANLKGVQEALYAKEALIQSAKQADLDRVRIVAQIEHEMGHAPESLTVSKIVLLIQPQKKELAESIRSSAATLVTLMERVIDQNASNRSMVEASLEHLRKMKNNIVQESSPKRDTYTAQGQRTIQSSGAKIISREV